ncbi:hypothetical protein [Streptomyces cyaneofuscatus]|uniref:hypothetical protein n=1 Tax=Streptomyces cyaneofuscatus TaxID=66883 RepID=UPI00378C5E6C
MPNPAEDFEITAASAEDIVTLGAWAHEEGWNPGLTDGGVFFPTDPGGFRTCWSNARYEGTPPPDIAPPPGTSLVDARTVPFARLAAYDRRFFPAPRDGFLAAWITAPGRTALAAVRDGELQGLGVVRACRSASRIGPLYAASPQAAAALVSALAATVPDGAVAVDVPDVNPAAVRLAGELGLTPSFDTARMYTGPEPVIDRDGYYGITSLELG